MGRFVFDPATGLMLPRRAEPRVGKQLCSLFTAGPGFFAGAAGPPPPTSVVWVLGPNSIAAGYVLSNSDKTVDCTNGVFNSKSCTATPRKTGKRYWETVPSGAGITGNGAFRYDVGIANQTYTDSADGATRPGASGGFSCFGLFPAGIFLVNGNTTGSGPTYGAGTVLMWAYDQPNGNVWVGSNGTWFGGGDPAAGTGVTFSYTATSFAPVVGDNSDLVHTLLRSLTADFSYTVPTGFTELAA